MVELIKKVEMTPTWKLERVEWMKIEPIDMPFDANFDFNNINSLWYC